MTDWSDYAREVQAAADSAGRRADTEMKSLKCRIQELEKACKEWADVSQSNYQRAKAAEAKLAEAVKALDETRIVLAENEPHLLPVLAKVLATFEKLKVQDDE